MAIRMVNNLARAQGNLLGGADEWSMRNYRLPGYNPVDRTWEKHLPFASYAGPGTDIQKRWLNKKLHGTTQVDEAARHHDIQYYNLGLLKAQQKITDGMLARGIYQSDNQLAKAAQAGLRSRNPINALQSAAVLTGIKAKQGLQSAGLMNRAAFTTVRVRETNPNNTNPNAQPIGEDEPQYESGGKKKDRLKRLRKALKKSS